MSDSKDSDLQLTEDHVLRDYLDAHITDRVADETPHDAASLPQDLLDRLRRAERCAATLRQVWGEQEAGEPGYDSHAQLEMHTPDQIGRYRIEGTLGKGGFGYVFLGYDEQLQRHVAVKVPYRHLLSGSDETAVHLSEARSVAQLDHPNIVPVYDVGMTDEFPCYIVSKYVQGDIVTRRIRTGTDEGDSSAPQSLHFPSHSAVAELIATIADALHHAHLRGLTHRDIKPGNILIDAQGNPHVTDFGLALKDTDVGQGPRYVGTAAYMSPEQARGEGHRVDGRSDIYSLGAVLYELLVGHRPFPCDSREELFEQITSRDPPRLRTIDDSVPAELERICLKSLSRQLRDRYVTAKEMASDLRRFARDNGNESGTDSQVVRVVPKGLRSFDAHDADFFLSLLPGPRDRDGLPESIRFWKTRVEETEPDKTFSVGVIYGPSGCGKSSLVKAGLLPRLETYVMPVYVESSADTTEARLLEGLRNVLPSSSGVRGENRASLPETLAMIRRGDHLPVGRKVLVVLDQFEQWLHANHTEGSELVQALRQCDGGRVQCIGLIRDDFWMAITRFMRSLDIPLVDGHNSIAVDLFSARHAQEVLTEFGRAFGTLPQDELSDEQSAFVTNAVAQIASSGSVACVQIALFAEMMKDRSWTLQSLRSVGGFQGVGSAFLEETFSGPTAPPEHRLHQRAAGAILAELLPPQGTDIKGHRRPARDLSQASGYANRPGDFDRVIRILDGELRLITLTEAVDDQRHRHEETTSSARPSPNYQLTHDYLVPSLRDWLTRKQKATRRGRAELCLAERAGSWKAKTEKRHLPSWWEYLKIVTLTSRTSWTETQREMMRVAGLHHLRRAIALAGIVVLLGCVGYEVTGRARTAALVGQLASADEGRVLEIVNQLHPYRRWARPRLQARVNTIPKNIGQRREQLHARLALVVEDASQSGPLLEAALESDRSVSYVKVIRQALQKHQHELRPKLWSVLQDASLERNRRFRAGLFLADYHPAATRWSSADETLLAESLSTASPDDQPILREQLRPLSDRLIDDLERLFAESEAPERQLGATTALADFGRHDVELIARLIASAEDYQFRILHPVLASSRQSQMTKALKNIVEQRPGEPSLELGEHRASAAAAMLHLGEREKIFPIFEIHHDVESITQFAHGCRDRGVTADQVVECFQLACVKAREGDRPKQSSHLLYGLMLALGEFSLDEIPASYRDQLIDRLGEMYAHDPSSAVHGASGWLLRHWKRPESVQRVDQTPLPYDPAREWFVLEIDSDSTDQASEDSFHFTFVVVPTGTYHVNSIAPLKDGRDVVSTPDGGSRLLPPASSHTVQILRPYAILNREVTFAELEASGGKGFYNPAWDQVAERAAVGPTWYEAVQFCRWLTSRTTRAQAYAAPVSQEGLSVTDADSPLDLDKNGFRLPTSVEWEVAASAGLRCRNFFGWGDRYWDRYAWSRISGPGGPRPPAGLRPSVWGLHDMVGNASEWCHDRLPSCLGAEIENNKDYIGRIDRKDSRTHGWGRPDERRNETGLRIVVTLP